MTTKHETGLAKDAEREPLPLSLSFRAAALAAGVLLTATGCASHRKIRTEAAPIETTADRLLTAEGRAEAAAHSVEVHPDFTLVFVEFDDQGRFWDRHQVEAMERTLRAEADRPGYGGVIVTLFAHGWQHDASVCDHNVTCFRAFLASIARDSNTVTRLSNGRVRPRRLVGVYVGWRGRSGQGPLKELTFFARKKVAQRIGSGDLVELLTRVDVFVARTNRDGLDRARMVTLGHSFGGTMIYTALANVLKIRVVEALLAREDGRVPVIRGFGDVVVLINPAFDAAQYRSLHELTRTFERFAADQPPVLITIASETDSANATWFPLGRALESVWEKTADAEEGRSLRTAVGNWEPFFGYRLTAADGGPPARTPKGDTFGPGGGGCACDLGLEAPDDEELALVSRLIESLEKGSTLPAPVLPQRTCDAPTRYGRAELACATGADARNPFWVVRATDDVVRGHSGFFTNGCLDFIRGIVKEAVSQKSRIASSSWRSPDSPASP